MMRKVFPRERKEAHERKSPTIVIEHYRKSAYSKFCRYYQRSPFVPYPNKRTFLTRSTNSRLCHHIVFNASLFQSASLTVNLQCAMPLPSPLKTVRVWSPMWLTRSPARGRCSSGAGRISMSCSFPARFSLLKKPGLLRGLQFGTLSRIQRPCLHGSSRTLA